MRDEVYRIDGPLQHKYKGAGYALAAVVNGELIDFVYLRDILGEADNQDIVQAFSDKRLVPAARYLSSLGEIRAGSCVDLEFRVL